jgi:hypothetical protein
MMSFSSFRRAAASASGQFKVHDPNLGALTKGCNDDRESALGGARTRYTAAVEATRPPTPSLPRRLIFWSAAFWDERSGVAERNWRADRQCHTSRTRAARRATPLPTSDIGDMPSSIVSMPLDTAATTATLRRATHLRVLVGGSSVISI